MYWVVRIQTRRFLEHVEYSVRKESFLELSTFLFLPRFSSCYTFFPAFNIMFNCSIIWLSQAADSQYHFFLSYTISYLICQNLKHLLLSFLPPVSFILFVSFFLFFIHLFLFYCIKSEHAEYSRCELFYKPLIGESRTLFTHTRMSRGGVLELFFDEVCDPRSESPTHI